MTPAVLADLHAKAFSPERGWTAEEFGSLLASPHTYLFTKNHGFALVRAIAGEAELLTLAVDPAHQQNGIANGLMLEWMRAVPAKTAFLEVAADNMAAQALYTKHGFAKSGLRKAYYRRPNGPTVDAVLMQAALTCRQTGESTLSNPKTG